MFDYARINFLFATIALVLSAIAACDIYFRAKPGKFRLSFFILLFLLSAWSSGFIMESIVLENHLFIRFIAYSMIFAGICCSGVFWLWFCLYFGQQSGKVLTKLKLFTAIPTVIILVFFITNPIHKLLYWIPNDRSMNFSSEYFYDLFFMLIHVIIGNIILIGNFLRNKKLSLIHKSILIIILSTVTSAIVLRIFLIKVVEITPLFMVAGSTLIFYLSALRYKLFNIIPASIVSFVQSMDQSILIADNRLNIVGFNNSFSNAFKHVCHINESDSLGVFAQALMIVTDDNYDTQNILKGMLSKNEKRISGHIHIRTTRDIWYSVIAQQVLNSKGKMIGRLISFNDITTIHKLSEELRDKSEKLENMNNGLKAANEEILKHTL
ncbi:MAG: histidine kinase N-terminal 7TM domain-containing protein, partial [Bacillota bacterium]|nr:histidine kinase N-terminal 7TM domain-containing protein [Bacillota bacterium]